MKERGGMRMSGREQFTHGVLTDFGSRQITRTEAAKCNCEEATAIRETHTPRALCEIEDD